MRNDYGLLFKGGPDSFNQKIIRLYDYLCHPWPEVPSFGRFAQCEPVAEERHSGFATFRLTLGITSVGVRTALCHGPCW